MAEYSHIFIYPETKKLLDDCKKAYLEANEYELEKLGIKKNHRITYDFIVSRIAEKYLDD